MSDQDTLQAIVIVPVDENNRPLLFSDVKIEKVDKDFRTLRDAEGLTWELLPGEYTVKVFLRDLQMKSVPLRVNPGVLKYRLPVTTTPAAVTFEFSDPSVFASRPATIPNPVSKSADTPAGQQKLKVSDSGPRKRFPINFPVSYRTDQGKWMQSKALNVSASGLCVENVGQVTEDDNLYVKLHVPIATIPIECPARVVWVMTNDSQKSCMGLQLFLTSNMRESLDRWLSGI